jgi:hypothetical protein
MRPYMAYAKGYRHECAVLVIAESSRKARPLAWRYGWEIGTDSYTDLRVERIRDDADFFMSFHGDKREPEVYLSPPTCKRCEQWGRTLEETWTALRHRLLDLGTLPYRVANLNPSGFSLNPAGNDKALLALYAHPTPAAAEPDFDRLDVRWVAAPGALEVPGWRLREDNPWRLYERSRPSGDGAVLSGATRAAWSRRIRALGRDEWTGVLAENATLVTRTLWQKDWIAGTARGPLDVLDRDGLLSVRWASPRSQRWASSGERIAASRRGSRTRTRLLGAGSLSHFCWNTGPMRVIAGADPCSKMSAGSSLTGCDA